MYVYRTCIFVVVEQTVVYIYIYLCLQDVYFCCRANCGIYIYIYIYVYRTCIFVVVEQAEQ